ncbi:cyanophycinase [Halobacteroides halobius DSM 5150]|uniref:Cyanophycinase n=1 Tax=Halobacteroides halobius (strain ATCC 35273 / DSM 5150 / MD-1) TaxID=748449 RepID=L0K6E4_HALHC|nr:cyanophycinase [Halobacteroides halobius]AGB40110.1 cyanophycinase [Halobacteroides halobius DSM 5150]
MTDKAGRLVIIGGAEAKDHDPIILEEAANLVEERLLIITTATQEPKEAGEEYDRIFSKLGVPEVKALHINSRADAAYKDYVEQIEKADGVFFTGGNQLRITSLLGGSRVCDAIKRGYKNGKVIIGTSAGAAVMSRLMVVTGESDENAKQGALDLALGLGFLDNVIIDQHFSQRGRLGRLLTGLAHNPALLGVGIDENTAIIVTENTFEVIGSGTVTIVDCSQVKTTNISNLLPDEALTLTNVKLHILSKRYGFNLDRKKVILPQDQ